MAFVIQIMHIWWLKTVTPRIVSHACCFFPFRFFIVFLTHMTVQNQTLCAMIASAESTVCATPRCVGSILEIKKGQQILWPFKDSTPLKNEHCSPLSIFTFMCFTYVKYIVMTMIKYWTENQLCIILYNKNCSCPSPTTKVKKKYNNISDIFVMNYS